MCGFAGIFLSRRSENLGNVISVMCAQMQARGPDAYGHWSDEDAGLVLGHRRLSILDLESRANQPMHSDDGRYVIVFNGEIYNFRDLQRELSGEGEIFRTQSDTEVLLKLYARDGEAMLTRLRGMYAFAIWDRQTRSIFLARDPYGIKPLYIARSKDGWLFASQVKALLASGLVSHDADPMGQAGFWLWGSVPEPHTWFRDISALPAGSWCRISAEGQFVGPNKYWDIGDSWREAPECLLTQDEAQEVVRAAVGESVRKHLVSDVPVGVFLSGGIDSGSLAGLIKDAGASGMQGITIAFNEFHGRHENEGPVAAEIAQSYGIRHHVRTITRQEFEADLPRILAAMDQPSIDGINTWYASKAVAELGLKVVISGVGGDELFYGYPSFKQLPDLVSTWGRLSYVPGARPAANLALALLARRSGNPRWRWLTRQAGSLYGAYWLRRGLYAPNEVPALMGEESSAVLQNLDPGALLEAQVGVLPADAMAGVGQIESMAYLRNQLLRDSDWASMDHSVELRTPLVDAWLLRDLMPVLRSFGRLKGKRLLAASPAMPLDQSVVGRVKTGFGIPLGAWMGDALGDTLPAKSAGGQDGAESRRWASTVSKAVYAR
ncbi:MAG: asparagine synthase (glutamine-hydrolyzing) [Polaromonas sp.]|nr:asparagine synthase (glutamine-hydrolyzing) [Polaromonas sp.]MDP3751409.1 asparagine synthase (glutamine-hydrolyzing) [Polaromonas sp.]MDZ4261499.1 asparagine synthase (glutamine-hydrolyzing) [Pseudomonadota bacterium]